MENFDAEKFEKRLLNLKNTQDAITGLSQWCLAKRAAHKQIVRSWLKILKEVKIESRLTLFYLANDVIQHSKRKNFDFVESWGTSLQRATTLVRDDKVKEKISRIFNIWEQREVYSEEFISDLNGLLAINNSKKTSITSNSSGSSPVSSKLNSSALNDEFDDDFQLSSVVSGIRNCVELESETNKQLTVVVKTQIPDLEKIRNALKDRAHVEDADQEMEAAALKFNGFMSCLNEEIQARKILLTALDQAEKFYRSQRRDVKKVVYAYKNFGDRINQIQSELETKIPTLQSPCPSPPINAPSPEPDNDDFDIPNETSFYKSNMNGSFLKSSGPLPFDPSEFYRRSPTTSNSQNNSIQVVRQNSQTAPINDFYNTLNQPKIETYSPPMSYNPQNSYQPTPMPPLPTNEMSNYVPSQNSSYMVPPPPPSTSHTDYTSGIPLPPSQADNYSSWNWNASIETPNSPPTFERKGHNNNMVEYIDDSLRNISDSNDIDHRMLRTSESDGSGHDVDHRNLISLTGSPANGDDLNHRVESNQFLTPPLEPPSHYNNFMNDSNDLSKPPPNNYHLMGRMPRQPSGMGGQRLNRNTSYNSDSSRTDEIETVDMEMSDDDTGGIDNQSVGSSSGGDNRDFSMPNIYQLPNQVNLNRPPPMMNVENEMNPHRNMWMQNPGGNDSILLDDVETAANFSGHPPPPQFMPPGQRGNFQGSPNFRGGHRGGKMLPRMNSPYNASFRGVGHRGGINNRGRGGRGFIRGNIRGQW